MTINLSEFYFDHIKLGDGKIISSLTICDKNHLHDTILRIILIEILNQVQNDTRKSVHCHAELVSASPDS